jgi:neutral ceramidase
VALAGFAARTAPCVGTHDDLYARALVLDNGRSTVALISADLLALPAEFVDRVRAEIAARIAIEAGSILIACTHTHAGPTTIRAFFNPEDCVDAGLMDRLAEAIADAAAEAWKGRREARIGVGVARIENFGVNRRTGDGRPVDEEIGILKVADPAGVAQGVLFHYGCHPTVLGPDNLLATGDFPGAAVARIQSRLGGFAMFCNGTEGDISVGHSSELSAIGVIAPGRTFERAAELGGQMADTVLAAIEEIETTADAELGACCRTVGLPQKTYPPVEETERALREAKRRAAELAAGGEGSAEYRQAKSELLYRSIEHYYAHQGGTAHAELRIALQALRVQDATFAAVPGEVFAEIGLRVKRSAAHPVFVTSLANGYIGYLPSRRAYAAGGYEVVSSQCTAEAEDRLVKDILELQRELIPTR